MTFPAQIKQLRLALRLTQVELGALLDVSAQSICNWERGRSLPWEKDREGYLVALRNGHTSKPRERRRIGDDL